MKKNSLKQQKKYVSYYQQGISVEDICKKYKIPKSSLYLWISKYKETITAGERVNVAEYQKIRSHSQKLEQIIEVLQKVDCSIQSPLANKLRELEKLKDNYSIRVLCEALMVNRNTFNAYLSSNTQQVMKKKQRNDELKEKIFKLFTESNQTYGAYRIREELKDLGYKVAPQTVSLLMKELGLSSNRGGSKKEYLKILKEQKTDLVQMNFTVTRPNEIWVSDVTYLKFKDLFYYLCTIIDLYSRKVIAYHISTVHSTQLITTTFRKAYNSRNPKDALIFHSDRGTQYTSNRFRLLLKSFKVQQSFSKPYNPYNNSVAESFFATLKKEEYYRKSYRSVKDLTNHIQLYIEFYNSKRKHSTLHYKTPNQWEDLYYGRNDE
ncbi:MAG: IS3 family transposase [Anaerorhabdus sp.]|uniref:IS3 family transposase n=1 Tax=Anaerorhabdus sp. TaxID=1872524 RepID=UPI002B2144C8|nr:IS3 family transposase [Anaerorhabdus sp.]MEA4875622.1 IS3 family transposase [Anaerorhabdus sp.]